MLIIFNADPALVEVSHQVSVNKSEENPSLNSADPNISSHHEHSAQLVGIRVFSLTSYWSIAGACSSTMRIRPIVSAWTCVFHLRNIAVSGITSPAGFDLERLGEFDLDPRP